MKKSNTKFANNSIHAIIDTKRGGLIMIVSLANIDNSFINQVCNSYEEDFNFESLKIKYPKLDHNVLFSILYSSGIYGNSILRYLCQEMIRGKKILIMSDTHYGSKLNKILYTDEAFNFGIKNGIHTFLHGGDIIESELVSRKGYNNVRQANYFIERFPYDNTIKTLAVLGNHDYLAINKDEIVKDILNSRDDITILGFKKVFINWCGLIISLQHDVIPIKLDLPFRIDFMSFKGHSHFYHIKKRRNGKCEGVFLPSMCNNKVNSYTLGIYSYDKDRLLRPGFVTAEMYHSEVVVTHYSFVNNEIIRESDYSKTLKRKI